MGVLPGPGGSSDDGSLGKPFTKRDELAFAVYQSSTGNLMFRTTDAGPMLDQEAARGRVQMAYQIVDAFLTYRRDK